MRYVVGWVVTLRFLAILMCFQGTGLLKIFGLCFGSSEKRIRPTGLVVAGVEPIVSWGQDGSRVCLFWLGGSVLVSGSCVDWVGYREL